MTDTNRDMHRDGLENRTEGTMDEMKGKTRNAVGGATGDTSQQLEGKAEELKGKAKQSIGETQQDMAKRDR